jgi:L-fuconolactonase
MWGSDISRFDGRIGFWRHPVTPVGDYPVKHTYAEALHYLRDTDELSVQEKRWILGGTVQHLLGWA